MVIGIDASRGFVDQPTGTERYSFELIRRIVDLPEARGHSWILYVRPGTTIFNYSFPKHVRIKVIPLVRLWTQVGLAVQTWTDGLDVLWVPAHTLPLLRKPGMVTVVTIHGIEYEWLPAYENKLQRWYLPLSTTYAVRSASRIISVSNFTKDQIVERMKGDIRKLTVVHEGFTQTTGEKEDTAILTKRGLQKHKYLLFIGTVQPRKNLLRLVRAFERLIQDKKYQDYSLVIGGKLGWGYESLLTYIKNSMISQKVVITGYLSEAQRYTLLRYAIVYVQPSITEGFGLPVLEAWSEGVPVVSSDGGALAEIVGPAGELFDPHSIDELVDQLSKVLGSAPLRRHLIDKGYERMSRFTWDLAAQATLDVLLSPRV